MMRIKERYEKALAWFEKNMPIAESELTFENEYQLLVAVMLSAQCTDKRVNLVPPLRMPSLLPHDLCHGRSSSRAPSSDRIPVELFQILKDDAVESAALNMQYAICTQYAKCRLTAVGESGLETC